MFWTFVIVLKNKSTFRTQITNETTVTEGKKKEKKEQLTKSQKRRITCRTGISKLFLFPSSESRAVPDTLKADHRESVN